MRIQRISRFLAKTAVLAMLGLAFGTTPVQAQKGGVELPTPTPMVLEKESQAENETTERELFVAPGNDDFNAAMVMGAFPFQNSVNTSGATLASDDPQMSCGSGQNSHTVWYRITASSQNSIRVSTQGSTYDTVLAVFTGSRGNLVRIACNDDAVGVQAELQFTPIAGQTYYIEVASYGTRNGGNLVFSATSQAQERRIANAYLEAIVSASGRYVIGTTGGDPNLTTDNNKPLLFGFPGNIGTSYVTVRVVGPSIASDYALGLDIQPTTTSIQNGRITTSWTIGNLRVSQFVSFARNPDTNRDDIILIEYHLANVGPTSINAGIRVMLDTMIGDNDGAPLFAPTWGRVTREQDSQILNVPDFWVAWESTGFDAQALKAKGVLKGLNSPPNRLVIARWSNVLCSGDGGLYRNRWDYTIDPNQSILCDSAVAAYYNPAVISPGQTRIIRTQYGLSSATGALALAEDIVAYIDANRAYLGTVASNSIDVSRVGDYFIAKLQADQIDRVVNLVFNGIEVFSAGINWAKVGRAASYIATPGYGAALHASWRGWMDVGASKHWYKPIYDAIQNNRKLTWQQTVKAGMHYYGKEVGIESMSELSDLLISALATSVTGTPMYEVLGVPMADLGQRYRAELQREQDEFLPELFTLTLSQAMIAQYRNDLELRRLANAYLVQRHTEHRNILWQSYQDVLADEANWFNFWGPLLVKWTVIGAATVFWDGPGFYLASAGTAVVSTIYDVTKDTMAITHDEKMMDQSLRFLEGRTSLLYLQASHNTVGGLNLIRAGDTPQIAGGTVQVGALRSYGSYRIWPNLWWAEQRSEIALNITNNTDHSTAYLPSASYYASGFWSGSKPFLPEGQVLELSPGASGSALIPLKLPEFGESPSAASVINMAVLGATETGLYWVYGGSFIWSNVVRVEQNSQRSATAPVEFTETDVDNAPNLPFPLISVLVPQPGTTDYVLLILVKNPFGIRVSAAITQAIPAGFTVLDSDGAVAIGNQITWQGILEPGTAVELSIALRWADVQASATASLPGAELSFVDPQTFTGDQYETAVQIIEPIWPLKIDIYPGPKWEVASSSIISVEIQNISSNMQASGTLRLALQDVGNRTVWSSQKQITVAPGQQVAFTVLAAVPNVFGVHQLVGDFTMGDKQRAVAPVLIDIQGLSNFLPLIRHDEYD